jgi:hypothetical protein
MIDLISRILIIKPALESPLDPPLVDLQTVPRRYDSS